MEAVRRLEMKIGLRPFALLLPLTCFVSPVFAGDSESLEKRIDRLDKLIGAKSLKCIFGPGSSASWETGEPKISMDEFNVAFHFDSINSKLGKARLIANLGAEDVLVLTSPSGLSFIEETASGNMTFTTVFLTPIKGSDEFPGVTSRHMEIFGSLIPSQYHGTCKIWG
jgi:hypothetical protein